LVDYVEMGPWMPPKGLSDGTIIPSINTGLAGSSGFSDESCIRGGTAGPPA